MKELEPLVLPTKYDRGKLGGDTLKDTRVHAIKHWDEYTPEYDGDDHLSDTKGESEDLKIGAEEAEFLVRHLYLTHFLCLLWNDSAGLIIFCWSRRI